MFEIIAEPELQERLKNLEKYYPREVCFELNQFLEILQRDGCLSKTDFYDLNTHKASGVTCNLFYRPNLEKKEVLLIDVRMKPADVFRQRFTIEDEWDDKDVLDSIPQCDKPDKVFQALMFIHQGITDSYELGYKLGHRGKKEKYISRHGQYAKHALEQLKLITKHRKGKQWITELTEKGRLIAEAFNESLQERLFIQSMLNYPPVWRIIIAVSDRESQLDYEAVLNNELVKNLAFPKVLQDADTSNRRSQTLKRWIKWVAHKSGIPIRLHSGGIQLTIPMLYAESAIDDHAEQE